MRLGLPYFHYIPSIPVANKHKYTTNKISNHNNISISDTEKKTIIQDNSKKTNKDNTFFDMLGLKMDSDDYLILGLLFFLFIEDVDDQILYIVLIMLLIS